MSGRWDERRRDGGSRDRGRDSDRGRGFGRDRRDDDRGGGSGICHDWKQGRCRFGDKCRYAHEGPGGCDPSAGGPGGGGGGGQNAGAYDHTFGDQRRAQREKLWKEPASGIWGPSPPPPDHSTEEDEEKAEAEKKRKKQSRKKAVSSDSSDSASDSEDDSSSSDSDDRKSSRKKSKRQKKPSKKRSKKKSKKSSRSKRKKKRSRAASSSDSSDSSSDSSSGSEDESGSESEAKKNKQLVPVGDDADLEAMLRKKKEEEEEDVVVGPLPIQKMELSKKDYGGALLPGEGEGMAAYVDAGKRIPRRGEIGLTRLVSPLKWELLRTRPCLSTTWATHTDRVPNICVVQRPNFSVRGAGFCYERFKTSTHGSCSYQKGKPSVQRR
eukprot:m.348373 g.348373  ORF g.348373 m.348373 type:complete len:381 (+) comp19877_c0_seq5:769-1911(+)